VFRSCYHYRTVSLVDRITFLSLVVLCLTVSDVLSDVPVVLEMDGSRIDPSLGCMVSCRRSETMAVSVVCVLV
jgi:hypothetical protein